LALTSRSKLSLNFKRVPLCSAVEGQELEDIDVFCTAQDAAACYFLVLHDGGSHISACRLTNRTSSKPHLDQQEEMALQPPPQWTIAGNWLNGPSRNVKKERVKSIAVNAKCADRGADGIGLKAPGCAYVGTTQGRLVKLRGSSQSQHVLVPSATMHQHQDPSSRGSLTVLGSGVVVALWHGPGTVSAFDPKRGKAIGEWRLPDKDLSGKKIQWLMLCGGGDGIFVVGILHGSQVVVYRFQVPQGLSDSGSASRRMPALPQRSEM